jgi:hypothetical protein
MKVKSMRKMGRLASLTLISALALGLGGCMHAEDPLTQYTQRTDKVTLSAGNSNAANLAIHTIDPWPRASANRYVPANGQRMADAYERYRDVSKVQARAPMISPVQMNSSGGGAATAAAR